MVFSLRGLRARASVEQLWSVHSAQAWQQRFSTPCAEMQSLYEEMADLRQAMETEPAAVQVDDAVALRSGLRSGLQQMEQQLQALLADVRQEASKQLAELRAEVLERLEQVESRSPTTREVVRGLEGAEVAYAEAFPPSPAWHREARA